MCEGLDRALGIGTSAEWTPYTDVCLITGHDLRIAKRAVGGPAAQVVSGLFNVEVGGFMARVPGGRVMWTRDGKRVTMAYNSGAVIASCSREVDPTRPE